MSNPKLRFKREDGTDYPDWEENNIENVATLINGRAYKSDEFQSEGKYLILRVGNLFTNETVYYSDLELEPDKYIDEGDLIYAWSATFGARIYHGEKCIYHYHIWKVIPNGIDKIFLLYSLNNDVQYISSELNGGTMHHLTKAEMEKRFIFIPCLEEQKKIADFLSTVDEIIAQSEKEVQNLEQQKKAAMQKIFSQEVRFKREDGTKFPEWEELTMEEIFTEIIEKNRTDLPVLSILQGQGTVYRDSSDRNIMYDKKSIVNYKAMKKGDFIIHLRSFEGGLECATLDGISSPAYKILRTDKLTPEAYKDYFRSRQFIEGKLAIAVTGVRDGKNIEMSTFWQILLPVPCLEEQQKIAAFLSAYDEVISFAKQELDKWKELKKGLLQQMFV